MHAILLHYSAPESLIALAAWASTTLETGELESIPVEGRLGELLSREAGRRLRSPEQLIRFLAESGHTSPFRHLTFTYLISVDTATHCQLLKHRVGVEINSESARYKRVRDRFYIPGDLPEDLAAKLEAHSQESLATYREVFDTLVSRGFPKQRAKELARFFLPVNREIESVVTLSAQALGHLYHLRAKPEAQPEIRWVAEECLQAIAQTHPLVYSLIREGYLV